MSVGSLLNDTSESEREDISQIEVKDKDNETAVVRMLSLNTQATNAKLKPIPLSSIPYRSPPASSSGVQQREFPTMPIGRKRVREVGDGDGEDEEEIQYLGRTPSTWKNWEAAGGVRSENGSPYCYAYDDAGQRTSFFFPL
jgi:hypothetical protein